MSTYWIATSLFRRAHVLILNDVTENTLATLDLYYWNLRRRVRNFLHACLSEASATVVNLVPSARLKVACLQLLPSRPRHA